MAQIKSTAGSSVPNSTHALKSVLKVLFAMGLIYWLVRSEVLDLATLTKVFLQPAAAVLLLLAFMSIMIVHWRWLQLLRGQGLHFTFWSSIKLTFIGLFFNFAIPGGVGGDVVKTYYLVQRQAKGQKLVAAVTVLWDRLIGLFSMMIFAMIALLSHGHILKTQPEMRALTVAIGVLLGVFILGFIVLLTPSLYNLGQKYSQSWPRIHDILGRLEESMLVFRKKPMVFVRCMIGSWFSQLCAVIFVLLVAQMSSSQVDWSVYLFIVPLVFVAMALPISPAGIGVGQAAIYFLFKAATGEASAVGPNALTAWQLAQLLYGFVGAYFYLQVKQHAIPSHGHG